MAKCVTDPSEQNYYFKDSVVYTEDHIPVQKIYIYGLPPQLNQFILEAYFGMYGHVLRLQIFKPKNCANYATMQTGYVFYAQKTDAAKALRSSVHHLNGLEFHVRASDSWHQPDAYGMPRHLPVYPPDTKPPPPPPVMSLTDDCLEHVMTYLALPDQMHFARTCLRFRAVYQMATARLHKSVHFSAFEKMTVWDMRDFFRLSGAHVERIDGYMPKSNAQRLCNFLADSCRNVKTINMMSDIMSPRNMNKLFSKMHQLESLKLPFSNISDRSVMALANLRKLKTLNLSGNPLVGDTIARLPCTIETLTLNNCKSLEARNLFNILKTFHCLKVLNIMKIDRHVLEIFKECIMDNCCKKLETVRITGYRDIEYEFVAQLPNLKHLFITMRGPRQALYEQLARHKANQLECLEIYGSAISNKKVLFNIAKLSELHSLTLPYIENEAALVDAFSNHQKLEKLVLPDMYDISVQSLLKVFGACPKLSYIELWDATQLDEELPVGIVSRVWQEVANKDMHRKLPIKLRLLYIFNLDKWKRDRLDKLPKDIIEIRNTYHTYRDYYLGGSFDDYDIATEDVDLDAYEDDDEFEDDENGLF